MVPWHNYVALGFLAIFIYLFLSKSADTAKVLGALSSSTTGLVNALQGQNVNGGGAINISPIINSNPFGYGA